MTIHIIMNKMDKHIVKKSHYSLEKVVNVLKTIIKQYEHWTNNKQENYSYHTAKMYEVYKDEIQIAAEP